MKNTKKSNKENIFGGWSIEKTLYEFMAGNIPKGSNIIEFGSGNATKELMKHWNVWSIEQDEIWAKKCPSNVIFAPIKGNWYDRAKIEGKLPQEYYAVLVDGPTANTVGRMGMMDNIDLFNTDAMYIFDDINRQKDFDVMVAFCNKFNKEYKVFEGETKKFGVVYAKK